jgi:hypothetical protein
LLFWASAAVCQTAVLRESADVQGTTIRLSDLLPVGASPGLQKASAAVEIGRSPQRGSVRIFETGQLAHALRRYPELLHQISIPDRVLVRRAAWIAQREAIRDAIGRFLQAKSDGSNLPDSVLQAPGDIAATQEDAVLQVVGMARDLRGDGSEFRLRCVPPAACRRFVAHVVEVEGASSSLLSALPPRVDRASQEKPEAAKKTVPILAKAGSRATLLLESGNMSISLPVICLEPGALLQTIRVLDTGSHRVLRAEIVGAGKLHASL